MAVQRVAINQAAAGALAVVAAPGAGYHIEVVGFSLSMTPAGTVLFESGTTDLTGNMPWAAAAVTVMGTEDAPVMVCADNEALNMTSVTGAADGFLLYTIES